MTKTRWHTGTVDSGGESIYYEVVGDEPGPPILLTHGAGGSHAVWFQQMPAFAEAGHRVLTWDCRGFGNSTFRTGVHGVEAAVADMTAVLDANDIDRAHMVGQSMGGWWVTAFAIAHPERVRTLTLSNTVGGLWTDALADHFKTAAALRSDGDAYIGTHPALSPALVERDPARAFLYQQLNTFHTPPMREIGRALIGARFEHDALDATGIPVLVITGTDDELFPAALIRDSLGRCANATIVEIENSGHSPYFERPDEYNRALLDFIG